MRTVKDLGLYWMLFSFSFAMLRDRSSIGRAAPSSLTQLIGSRLHHDLPELPELDNLFSPEGPILDAQRLAAKLFGSSETWFLVGAISAMVLSGARPKYIIPQYDFDWDIAGGVEQAIKELEMEGQKAAAVFVTSPTYHGFHPQLPNSALKQGADLAVQSTHKVLCSLTQSSMLHISGNIVDRERICGCLQALQSTSPSYLLLASLDAARAQLSENPDTIFNKAMELAFEAKYLIQQIPGISLGLSGYEADEILCRDHGIIGIPVMIPGEVITEKALDHLLDVRSKGAVIAGASDPSLCSIVVCDV
nr:arginine decarboxylase [Quercus suber]